MRYEDLIKGITYEDIAKASPLAFVVWTFDDFKVIDWNKSAERIFGWKRKEVIGKNFFDFLIPKSAENKVKKVVGTLKAEKILTYSLNDNLTKDGKIIKCEWHNTPLKDKQGRITFVVSMAQDITDKVQREEKLKESEEKFRSVVDSTPNAIVTVDEKEKIIYWNRAAEKILGYSRDEAVGKKVTIIMPQKFRKPFEEEFKKAVSIKRPTREAIEVPAIKKDGTQIFIEWTFSGWRSGGKRFFTGIGKDITVRKKLEKKLREEKNRAQRYLDIAGCIILEVDKDHKVRVINQEGCRILEYDKEKIVGRDWFKNFLSERVRDDVEKVFEKLMAGEIGKTEYYENPVLTGSGKEKVIAWNNKVVKDDKGAILGTLSTGIDITDKRKQEEKIKRLYSLQKAVREINQTLLKVKTEPELFTRICKILVEEIKDFKFSWIGFLEKEIFKVKPVAHAGVEEGYLSSIEVRWDESKHGMGPTGMAIKEKRPFIVSDIENDPLSSPWRKEALKRGYKSSAVFPLLHKGEIVGALNIYSEKKDAFQGEEVEFLKEAASDIVIGIRSLRLEKELEKTVEELERTTEGIIWTIAKIVEIKDPYTSGHQRRVANLSRAIAKEMNLPQEQIEGVYMAATIHDIGKIYIPSEILSKPGKLTQLEFYMIRTHPQYGYNMLKDIDFPWPVALAVLQHHERLDGSGYPQGLFGKDIILEARILAVADVVEAMSSHRPYRPALSIDKALEEILKNKGILYDSNVVDVCVKLFTEKKFKFEQ